MKNTMRFISILPSILLSAAVAAAQGPAEPNCAGFPCGAGGDEYCMNWCKEDQHRPNGGICVTFDMDANTCDQCYCSID
ncbi:uncharacterized protein P174DRAFT_444480 [Aspergillus novofumigatus IBT 16806]|uniref:Uncharacterized protein n=1 Tax=Aspergillus novofumigatus (strain IBT 16806) TaxID=1392255 RepID=A0A2I1BZD1_ASPN1|nr:uncharacterized protein P174DRAFT_444480 [Aspergillus novofumigatus IBT 16806]PKX90714.1 hypothetical protein P174DRAFT_444480 [Aspergillus novofumigatus IBT 16806]